MRAAAAAPVRPPASRLELLGTLVERQVRLRSKRSVMGVLWPVAAPLFLLALYRYVFGSVFDVPVERYGVYLFAGLLPWTFLVQASHDALQSISFEPDLVRRAPFPHEFLPLARVAVMAAPFVALLAGFAGYLAVTGELELHLLPLLVPAVAGVVLVVAAVAVLLALVDVFTRDLRFVLNNLFTLWFFATPIVYHRRMVGGPLRALEWVDPMRMHIRLFRDVLYTGRVDEPVLFAVVPAVGAACFVASLAVFRRLAVDLAKDV